MNKKRGNLLHLLILGYRNGSLEIYVQQLYQKKDNLGLHRVYSKIVCCLNLPKYIQKNKTLGIFQTALRENGNTPYLFSVR